MYPVNSPEQLYTKEPDINYKWGLSHLDNIGWWTNVSKLNNLTENFIRTNHLYLNWWYLSSNTALPVSKEFIREFADEIKWKSLSKQALTEEFIDEFSNYVDWNAISYKNYLSDEFLLKHAHQINWSILSKYRKVSEEFMEKFSNYIDWTVISTHQKMSEEFINKHFNKLDIICMSTNHRIPYNYRAKLKRRIKKMWEEAKAKQGI